MNDDFDMIFSQDESDSAAAENGSENVEPQNEVIPPQEVIDTQGGTQSDEAADEQTSKEAVQNKRSADTRSGSDTAIPRNEVIPPREIIAKQEREAVISGLGLVNPETGKPVTTEAEYNAYREYTAKQAKRNFINNTGISDEDYDRLIGQLPEVIEAKRAKAIAEQQSGIALSKAREVEARAKIDEQMKELAKLDTNIKSIDDLMAMESYPQFYELVKRGNNFVDAYKLANYDELIKKAAAAQKQKTLNSQSGKSHMTPANVNQGKGLAAVPSEELELYRYLNPGMSDEEIARDYASRLKERR